MKNITQHTGKLRLIERLKNSYAGNPQFILAIMDSPNKDLGWTFRTPKNSSLGYVVQNYIDKDIDVTVTLGTHYGCCTLDNLWKVQIMWKVTYAVDSLDPNPTVKTFDEEHEAIDWLGDEISRRVDHVVQHSPYSISESELVGIQETEASLARIDRV